jgi:chromosome segregation ATPase
MAYLTIKQIQEQYELSEKTIRRLYQKTKDNPDPIIKKGQRIKGYQNKKGRWVINSDLLEQLFAEKRKDHTTEQPIDQVREQPKTSQTKQATSQDQALLKTIEVLQEQLKEKDRQLERYDQKLDQQQKLTAQLQNQLLIASPTEPITADITPQPPKPQTQRKKAVKKPVRKPQSKQKATKPKKKSWWRRG